MKTLVYTTAFGEDHFFLLAEKMLRSLRKRGYAGDAVVVCDRSHAFPPELEATVLSLPHPDKSMLFKVSLPFLMDVSGYDRILFVDSDVVFLRDPDPLFSMATERMVISRDHCPLRRNNFNLTFFSPEEKRDAHLDGTRSVNTGVLGFPGPRYYAYVSRWLEAWNAPEVRKKLHNNPMKFAELRDQPVMQKLVTSGGVECDYFPDELLLMPLFFTERKPLHPDTVVLHLNGSSRSPVQKRRLLEIMDELESLETHEEFKKVCDGLQMHRRQSAFTPLP